MSQPCVPVVRADLLWQQPPPQRPRCLEAVRAAASAAQSRRSCPSAGDRLPADMVEPQRLKVEIRCGARLRKLAGEEQIRPTILTFIRLRQQRPICDCHVCATIQRSVVCGGMRLRKPSFDCLSARKTQRVEEKLWARGATEARVPLLTSRSNVTLLVHSSSLCTCSRLSFTPCPPFWSQTPFLYPISRKDQCTIDVS
jgi:hypothetical protein